MKAMILKEYKHLEIKDIPMPYIESADEVLIRVKATAICGSDIHGFDGSTGRRQPPLVMGHEASGVVESVGPEVKTLKIGDRVTFDSTIWCGQCYFCRQGQVNLCDARRVLGVSCDEYRQDGTFAEYVIVPERIVYRLPDNVAFEEAALTEPVSVAMHAFEITDMKPGESAAVVGTGLRRSQATNDLAYSFRLTPEHMSRDFSQGTVERRDLGPQPVERLGVPFAHGLGSVGVDRRYLINALGVLLGNLLHRRIVGFGLGRKHLADRPERENAKRPLGRRPR